MDINFELYKTFFYVVETGSFSGAALILYVSQSAVSQSIKTLEQRIGYPLFIRSTKMNTRCMFFMTMSQHARHVKNIWIRALTLLTYLKSR